LGILFDDASSPNLATFYVSDSHSGAESLRVDGRITRIDLRDANDDGTLETVRTVVVDGRPRLATRERFPDADELVVGIPSEVTRRVPLLASTAVVLVAHEGCAYYLRRLGIPVERAEAAQREDLTKASDAILKLAPGVSVTRYFARHAGTAIRFEPV